MVGFRPPIPTPTIARTAMPPLSRASAPSRFPMSARVVWTSWVTAVTVPDNSTRVVLTSFFVHLKPRAAPRAPPRAPALPNRAFRWPPLQRQLLSSRSSHRVASVRRAGVRSRRPHRTRPPPQHQQDMAQQPSHPVLPLAGGLLQIGCRMWFSGCSSIAGLQVTSVRSLDICLGVSLAETGTGAV